MKTAIRFPPRQRQVLELVARGLTNPEIGEKLGIGKYTVREHLQAIFRKLGVQKRTEVAAWVERNRQ